MRIAVLADIHGNVLALDAVLADLERRGGADILVNAGDLVSGPLWPAETMARLARLDAVAVRGNHDRRVAGDPGDPMGPSDRYAFDRLSDAQRAALGALPLIATPAPGVGVFHARPDHDEKYLADAVVDGRLVRAPLAAIDRRLAAADPSWRILIAGHSHRPDLIRLPDGRVLFNPGSVGNPAYRDGAAPAHVSESGSPLARYGLVDVGADADAAVFLSLAVPYDHAAAAARADAGGRPEWAHALRTGFMPR